MLATMLLLLAILLPSLSSGQQITCTTTPNSPSMDYAMGVAVGIKMKAPNTCIQASSGECSQLLQLSSATGLIWSVPLLPYILSAEGQSGPSGWSLLCNDAGEHLKAVAQQCKKTFPPSGVTRSSGWVHFVEAGGQLRIQ
jgi:hypothetical protein